MDKTAATSPAMMSAWTEKTLVGPQSRCTCLTCMFHLQETCKVQHQSDEQPTMRHPALMAGLRVYICFQYLSLSIHLVLFATLRLTCRAACADTGGEWAQNGHWEGFWQAAHVW